MITKTNIERRVCSAKRTRRQTETCLGRLAGHKEKKREMSKEKKEMKRNIEKRSRQKKRV